jgi:hypothetical protein
MEQAGEAVKGESKAKEPQKPAAIFAFFVPHVGRILESGRPVSDHLRSQLERLRQFPVSNKVIDFPHVKGGGKLQVEPEVALFAKIESTDATSSGKRMVKRLVPLKIAAFNDCSMRQLDGMEKLSGKKNWGFGSKGISLQTFDIHDFSPFDPRTGKPTLVSRLWITSYVKRNGAIHRYTQEAPARNYLLFFQELLDWIVEQMNHQQDGGKWEDISEMLEVAQYPGHTWIALGAGEYTEWGAANYLQPLDEAVVMLYDEAVYPNGPSTDVIESVFEERGKVPDGIAALHQTLVP